MNAASGGQHGDMQAQLQRAYHHLNKTLFAGLLPARTKIKLADLSAENCYGIYYPSDRSISIDHAHMKNAPKRDVLASLVHEMCHLEEDLHGDPNSDDHGQDWHSRMARVGLAGYGHKKGFHHWIIDGGEFDAAVMDLIGEDGELLQTIKGKAKMESGYRLRDAPRGPAIASARWADPDYISDRYFYRPGDIWIGRNPHDFDQAIGYRDDRHILVCAGSGSGKGRSFIINNLALWPGSTVTFDPKPELPRILADRRGNGAIAPDAWQCEGMGQDVFVLDPLGKSGVAPGYLAYFDPLSGLDPEDGELPTWCKRIANSLIQLPEGGGESAQWAKRGGRLISLIMQHVVTSKYIKKKDRNLITVLRLLLEGNVESAQALNKWAEREAEKHNAELAEGEEPAVPMRFDPYDVLIRDMMKNDAVRGWIAAEARNLKRIAEKTPKYFESVRGEAAELLEWFKSEGIERCLAGWDDETRRFNPHRLKTDPNGITVFIVMPSDDLETYAPWVRSVFLGIFAAMRSVPGPCASGHQTLMMLDEFSSLGYQDYLATALDNIRGAGAKLAIIVQNFGALKDTYGGKMESFFTNSSLELYFGKVGETAATLLEKQLGQTEVVRMARSENRSDSVSKTISEAVAYGHTESYGGSDTHTTSDSKAFGTSKSWQWSDTVNWSDSENWGEASGESMGANYGPHVWHIFANSKNYGTNLSRNRGGGHTSGGSKTRGRARSENLTQTHSESRAQGSSWQRGTSRTETTTRGQTTGYQIGSGVAETFHKKPLLEAHEIELYLRSFNDRDRDHPAYPGLMLVRIHGELPFFVRRSNYDQDPFFEHCFAPDPAHKFLPVSTQPLLGYQYTPDHILPLQLPSELAGAGYSVRALKRPYQNFNPGDGLFEFAPAGETAKTFTLPNSGRVLAIHDRGGRGRSPDVMTVRVTEAYPPSARQALVEVAFQDDLAKVRYEEAARQRIADEKAAAEREEAALTAEERRRRREDAWETLRAQKFYALGWPKTFQNIAGILIVGWVFGMFASAIPALIAGSIGSGPSVWLWWVVTILLYIIGTIGYLRERSEIKHEFQVKESDLRSKYG